MLVNKIIFDSAVVLFNAISAGKKDDYFEIVQFVNDWERLKGFCPSDIVDQLKSKVKSVDTLAVDMGWRVFESTDLYVVDIDFKGWINTGVILIDGVQCSQYGDKKISDYDQAVYKVVNKEDLDQLMKAHNKSLVTSPQKISGEHYNNMLEVLPPCRWHSASGFVFFHISERITDNLVTWFCKYGDNFYSFTNDAALKSDRLVEIMEEAI